ncbi:CBN-TLI-1 protein [Aphelenchoides avenae]|nr:CBN-TLI-1 protein [Aphelenchus avenae]
MAASTSAAAEAAAALPSKRSLNVEELKRKVFTGPLPDDFLRLTSPYDPQQSSPERAAQYAAQQQQQQMLPQAMSPAEYFFAFVPPHTRGRICVKIVEAKLTKNYGLLRMDLYARVRIGNTIFETPTAVSAGKAPAWNRTINAYLPEGVESIYIQIFDERSFTNDECIAWSHIILPEAIFNSESIDEWYPLSGQQGEGKEGVVNMVISFSPVQQPPPREAAAGQAAEAPEPAVPLYTDDEVKELVAMFPNVEEEVVRSVLDMKRGDKDATVTALIEMSS